MLNSVKERVDSVPKESCKSEQVWKTRENNAPHNF